MPVILVPRREDGGHRDRVWAKARAAWESELGWPIYEGHHYGGPFERSAAINRASAQAGAWDVALVIDADALLLDLARQAREAAARCLAGRLCYAHDHMNMTTEDGVARWLAGEPLGPALADGVRHPNTFSSALAVPRALWDEVGGFDERFVGWGGEDLAFMSACMALGGLDRAAGDVFHLWHPRRREDNEGQPHGPENEELMLRYLAAKGNASAMRSILAER